jgi:hypothetical protein
MAPGWCLAHRLRRDTSHTPSPQFPLAPDISSPRSSCSPQSGRLRRPCLVLKRQGDSSVLHPISLGRWFYWPTATRSQRLQVVGGCCERARRAAAVWRRKHGTACPTMRRGHGSAQAAPRAEGRAWIAGAPNAWVCGCVRVWVGVCVCGCVCGATESGQGLEGRGCGRSEAHPVRPGSAVSRRWDGMFFFASHQMAHMHTTRARPALRACAKACWEEGPGSGTLN